MRQLLLDTLCILYPVILFLFIQRRKDRCQVRKLFHVMVQQAERSFLRDGYSIRDTFDRLPVDDLITESESGTENRAALCRPQEVCHHHRHIRRLVIPDDLHIRAYQSVADIGIYLALVIAKHRRLLKRDP